MWGTRQDRGMGGPVSGRARMLQYKAIASWRSMLHHQKRMEGKGDLIEIVSLLGVMRRALQAWRLSHKYKRALMYFRDVWEMASFTLSIRNTFMGWRVYLESKIVPSDAIERFGRAMHRVMLETYWGSWKEVSVKMFLRVVVTIFPAAPERSNAFQNGAFPGTAQQGESNLPPGFRRSISDDKTTNRAYRCIFSDNRNASTTISDSLEVSLSNSRVRGETQSYSTEAVRSRTERKEFQSLHLLDCL